MRFKTGKGLRGPFISDKKLGTILFGSRYGYLQVLFLNSCFQRSHWLKFWPFIAPSSVHASKNKFKQKAEAAENNGITAGHTNSYYLVFVISGGLSSLKSLKVHECTCNACKLYTLWGHNSMTSPWNPSKILQIFQIMLQNPSKWSKIPNRKFLMFYNG